jgi:hypothetical protein
VAAVSLFQRYCCREIPPPARRVPCEDCLTLTPCSLTYSLFPILFDGRTDCTSFYKPGLKPKPPRQSNEDLRSGSCETDRVLVCEFRDDEQAGAGVDVQVVENGELLLSQRCITGDTVRYVTQVFKPASLTKRLD